MRFTPDGPNVPATLIAAQERGEVLFVCGAGVSRGAGLPLFDGLVRTIYRELGESWENHAAEREVMEENGKLKGQYDRVLRALERRLIGGSTRGAQAIRGRIREAIRRSLQPKPNADLSGHLSLLQLSRDEQHQNRLLTTNFDTLFERAWRGAKGHDIPSYACQNMPSPRAANFSGVLHLHGILCDPEIGVAADSDLVLTSAEFGDAYLRTGWASRYVYDLVRSHILVLVGYAADDPPMRYLLEALEADRERYPDLRQVYAIAGAADAARSTEEALWRAKGVEPVIFASDGPREYSPLYDTLREWCSYAEDPTAWRRERLSALLSGEPSTANDDGLTEIRDLLSHGDAAALLKELSPAPAWLPVFADRGLPVTSSSAAAGWIASRVADPAMVEACAGVLPHQDAWWAIDAALADPNSRPVPDICRAWRWIRRASESKSYNALPRWYALRAREWGEALVSERRAAIVDVLRPRLQVAKPLRWPGLPEETEASSSAASLVRVDYEPHHHAPKPDELLKSWPRDARSEEGLLLSLLNALREALEEAREVGFIDGLDRPSWDVPAVSDHLQNRYRTGFYPIVRTIADLWARLSQRAPAHARTIAAGWAYSDFNLIRRLHIHALTDGAVFSGEEAALGLLHLSDAAFWLGDLQRETMRLMAERWSEFSRDSQESLSARLCAGMPQSMLPADGTFTEDRWETVRDHATFIRLSRILAAGGSLTPEMQDSLVALQRRHPGWEPGPGDRDDFRSWTSDWSRPQGQHEDLSSVGTGDLVAEAMRLERERPFEHGDTWYLFCEAEPQRALDGLLAEAEREQWKTAAWHTFLSSAERVDEGVFHRGVADALLRVPEGALRGFSGPAASWLKQRFRSLLGNSAELSNDFFDLWDHLADVTYVAPAENEECSEPPDDIVSAALNSPGGLLVWTLCSAISGRKPAEGSEFGDPVRRRLDRAIGSASPAGLHARGYLAWELPFLFHVDPVWTLHAMVPRLDPATFEGRLLWKAGLSQRSPQAPLFNALKPGLLVLADDAGFSSGQADGIAMTLMTAAIRGRMHPTEGWNITLTELRKALASTTAKVRHRAADILADWTSEGDPSERGERWIRQVGPFFEQAWPQDAECRDGLSSRELVRMVLATEAAFPDAVRTTTPLMVPFDLHSIEIQLDLDRRNGEPLSTYPREFITLLDALIDPEKAEPPRDLDAILRRCAAADPTVSEQPPFLRLRAVARRFGA